jgi:hypothetical protein
MAELVTRHASLLSFVEDCGAKPWQPGSVDCCLALAAWAMWLGHADPAAHLRGTYDDEEGFRAIIARAGGVVPVVQACVDRIGGELVDAPVLGAIGVIGSSNSIHRQWGAIFDGECWLVRTRNGFSRLTAPTQAIWEI